jgi:L-lactate dehydrogenase complex protein LldF
MAVPLPVLPGKRSKFDFDAESTRAAGDARLQRALQNSVVKIDSFRTKALSALPDSDALRSLARDIKAHTLDHLDFYIERFEKNVRARGGKVHLARDRDEAVKTLAGIVKTGKLRSCVKSKSMASEEIDLAHALQKMGVDVVETDLGEFIVQIAGDTPSHIVAPIVHLDRAAVGRVLTDHLQSPYTDDPAALTALARKHLRERFRHADLGITGGNFIIAESGQVVVVENEGNARQSTTTPRVLVCLVGIEKLLPRLADLAVFLKLLARSATGQTMTNYTSIFGGPRVPGEHDGPEEFHVILLDNGRSEILAGEYRETLACIRCGACLNACPVYRSIGGHSYGGVYSGPIGSLLTPLMQGLTRFKDLFQASTLCGACYHACPVKIDIPKHLVHLRQDMVSEHRNSPFERLAFRAWAWMLSSEGLYRLLTWGQRRVLGKRAPGDEWVERAPGPARAWTDVRPMPRPAPKTFRELWKDRRP